jgi:hypothetical protein
MLISQSTHRVAMVAFWRTVESIMMRKLAQAGEVGGCTPIPIHYIYDHAGTKLQCTLSSR